MSHQVLSTFVPIFKAEPLLGSSGLDSMIICITGIKLEIRPGRLDILGSSSNGQKTVVQAFELRFRALPLYQEQCSGKEGVLLRCEVYEGV